MGRPPKKGTASLGSLFSTLLNPDKEILETPDHPSPKKKTTSTNDFEHPLYEARRKDVREFYPIYSDRPGAWQADLMFMNYTNSDNKTKRHSILCMVNINTKYAFARQLIFGAMGNKAEDELWKSSKDDDMESRKPTISRKTATVCKTAMEHIVKDDFEKEEKWFAEQGHPNVKFKVSVIYTDDGSEFKGVFDQWCRSNNIDHVMFKPGEGKKTRLGIVERFNRTVRRYYEKVIYDHPDESKYFKHTLPQVLKIYNRETDHKGLRKFTKHLANGQRLEDGSKITPALMMLNQIGRAHV